MFEVIATLCAGALCGPVLLPGHEAASRTECQAALDAVPPATINGMKTTDPRCMPVGERLEVQEVAPGIHVHQGGVAEWDPQNRGDIANIAVVVGERSVAVIDTGSARWMGEALWRTVRSISDLPVSHVILTHVHPDHVFGAEVLSRAGAEIVGHEMLDRALVDRSGNYLQSLSRILGPEIALGTTPATVDVPVADTLMLDLGGRVLELRAWPTAHTGTDLTVVDAATDLLIAGDLVFDTHVPALDGSLRGWIATSGELMDRSFAGVVPGHGAPRLDWPDGAMPQFDYLQLLARETRAAISDGERLADAVDHVARSQAGDWALFDAFNARNVTVAFTELEWE